MTADYPLLLEPHLAGRVWGGARLGDGIGEAWDLSVHAHGPCRIDGGALAGRVLADVNAAYPEAFGGPIRLLTKRLDCAQDLSVQVHPRDGDPKTEAWFVLDAEDGAGVFHGFRRECTADEVRATAEDGTLPELLRFIETPPGTVVFVPSGTVHAIGGGLLLFEIQQSADTTYRLFDWGRGRALHLEQGLLCADLDAREAVVAPPLSCEHFFLDVLEGGAALDPGAAWVALFVIAGAGRLGDVDVPEHRTVLLPAAAGARDWVPRNGARALVYGPPAGSQVTIFP